jgi:hypothetical protein
MADDPLDKDTPVLLDDQAPVFSTMARAWPDRATAMDLVDAVHRRDSRA